MVAACGRRTGLRGRKALPMKTREEYEKVLRLGIPSKEGRGLQQQLRESLRWSSGNRAHILGCVRFEPCRNPDGRTCRSYRNGRWHSNKLNRNKRGCGS